MRRMAGSVPRAALLAALLLAACGGDPTAPTALGTTAPPTSADPGAADPGEGGSPTSSAGGPPITVDLDGRPDAVPEPPADGVPATAVPTGGRVALAGFGEVAVEVRTATGSTTWCLLLAETEAQRNRGLMEVTDATLGGYDGMLFRYPAEIQGAFYMRNTGLDLEIAFLDADGAVVSTTTMATCPDQDGCPTYPADGPFQRAVEVPVATGGLATLDLGPGAVLFDTFSSCSSSESE